MLQVLAVIASLGYFTYGVWIAQDGQYPKATYYICLSIACQIVAFSERLKEKK
jgi:hypothetical protein